MIPLKVHNVIDYVVGAVLMVSPWLFGMSEIDAACSTFLILGGGLIVYSLLTNYYFAALRLIPLGAHMTLDAVAGVVLILAPSLFDYRDVLTEGQYAVHMVLGLAAIGLVALTRPRTEAAKSPAERAAIAGIADSAHDGPLPHWS